MKYSLPMFLLLNPTPRQASDLELFNTVLSECDKYWMTRNYSGRNENPICNTSIDVPTPPRPTPTPPRPTPTPTPPRPTPTPTPPRPTPTPTPTLPQPTPTPTQLTLITPTPTPQFNYSGNYINTKNGTFIIGTFPVRYGIKRNRIQNSDRWIAPANGMITGIQLYVSGLYSTYQFFLFGMGATIRLMTSNSMITSFVVRPPFGLLPTKVTLPAISIPVVKGKAYYVQANSLSIGRAFLYGSAPNNTLLVQLSFQQV
jgi:hypothetical protein